MSNHNPLTLPDAEQIHGFVRERYGAIAEPADETCGCGATGCYGGTKDEASYGAQLGYTAEQLAAVPAGADLGLGRRKSAGDRELPARETVLDLGSGAGFDCFLAARQLAGNGQVIGVDLTAAMITKARANAVKSGFKHAEFRLGEIEALRVSDATVSLILSNCVINPSPKKGGSSKKRFAC